MNNDTKMLDSVQSKETVVEYNLGEIVKKNRSPGDLGDIINIWEACWNEGNKFGR